MRNKTHSPPTTSGNLVKEPAKNKNQVGFFRKINKDKKLVKKASVKKEGRGTSALKPDLTQNIDGAKTGNDNRTGNVAAIKPIPKPRKFKLPTLDLGRKTRKEKGYQYQNSPHAKSKDNQTTRSNEQTVVKETVENEHRNEASEPRLDILDLCNIVEVKRTYESEHVGVNGGYDCKAAPPIGGNSNREESTSPSTSYNESNTSTRTSHSSPSPPS